MRGFHDKDREILQAALQSSRRTHGGPIWTGLLHFRTVFIR